MAKFSPKPIDITKINNGNEWADGDSPNTETFNAPIESALYTESIIKAWENTKGIVRGRVNLAQGKPLEFMQYSLYVVQCFDSTWNTQKMTIIGGQKDGTVCDMALAWVGATSPNYADSLVLFTTGSINITNLGGTAGECYMLKPSKDEYFLSYYQVVGKRG